MDLLISVTEGRTGQLQFGLGYGSYGGLMINGSVSERNLFGTGQSGSIYANISTGTGQSYNFNYYGQTRKYNGRQFSGISRSQIRVFLTRNSPPLVVSMETTISTTSILSKAVDLA